MHVELHVGLTKVKERVNVKFMNAISLYMFPEKLQMTTNIHSQISF